MLGRDIDDALLLSRVPVEADGRPYTTAVVECDVHKEARVGGLAVDSTPTHVLRRVERTHNVTRRPAVAPLLRENNKRGDCIYSL